MTIKKTDYPVTGSIEEAYNRQEEWVKRILKKIQYIENQIRNKER